MAKFSGVIGFATQAEDPNSPGDWIESIEERHYYGDVYRNRIRHLQGAKVNPDMDVSNEISVIMDPFLNQHLTAIRYVTYMGAKWLVNDIDIDPPRMNLTIGGEYNE